MGVSYQGISPPEGFTHDAAEAAAGLHAQSDTWLRPDEGVRFIAPAYADTSPPYIGEALLRDIIYLQVPVMGETYTERTAPSALGEVMHGARLAQEVFWSMVLGGDVSLAEPELRPLLRGPSGSIESVMGVAPADGLNEWGAGQMISIGR